MSNEPSLDPQQEDEREEDHALSIRDFAASQDKPGMPGVRWYRGVDGRVLVGVPFGMNWSHAKDFQMPRVQSRADWEKDRLKAPVQTDGVVHLHVTKCSRCTILIGKGYFQNEAYLEPVLPADAKPDTPPHWQVVCVLHALEHGLHPGFCLLSEQDWVKLKSRAVHQTFQRLRADKIARLQHEIGPAWQTFLRSRYTAYRQFGKHWIAASPDGRKTLWERHFREPWATYTQLYYRMTAKDWWQRHDLTEQGCSEGHSRPEECSTSFHSQLVPLRLGVLFETFKAQYQPQIATLRDLLTVQINKGTAHAA